MSSMSTSTPLHQRKPPTYARSPLSQSSKASPAQSSDSNLFDAPPELICPITQAVFLDPVLTAAGHVYERQAVEQHLRGSDCDPLSREPLAHTTLTPIWALKSRALEYRESAARACLERACAHAPDADPVRCLRRAVELCAGTGFLPQGLTPEVAAYVTSHPSNAYDRLALQLLARSLHDNGYRERAAGVYFHLLSTDADRARQAEFLCRCLSCWTSSGGGLALEPPPAGPAVALAVSAAPWHGVSGKVAIDEHAYERLVALMDRRGSIGWVIEVAAEAGLGDEFVTRLCEALLFPRAPPAGPDGNAGPLSWDSEKQLLVTYTHVLSGSIKARQAALEARLEELEGDRAPADGRWREGSTGQQQKRGPGGGRAPVLRRPRWMGHPIFVAAACALALAAGEGGHPMVRRAARALPVMALLPAE